MGPATCGWFDGVDRHCYSSMRGKTVRFRTLCLARLAFLPGVLVLGLVESWLPALAAPIGFD
jgi:hypothetical protein